ncbi:DedA family protein [Streptomyces sp. NPDC101166]|uniref:DedA family protein n=1 Tax=Streptomyces sp. NPDC101166 TaxID=3366120 RepID=UPI0037F582B8
MGPAIRGKCPAAGGQVVSPASRARRAACTRLCGPPGLSPRAAGPWPTPWLLGSRLRTGAVGRRIPGAAWHRAESVMVRHGGRAVFFTRFVPVVRTLAPHFAGATGLPYRRIAPYSATAAGLWATVEAGAGYATTPTARRALSLGGPVLLVAAGVLAVAGAATWTWKRRRSPRPLSAYE